MPAPKGNKYALGHGCGRPKKWTDEAIQKEAEFLLEWAKKEDSLTLAQCYSQRGYSFESANDWEKNNEVFAEAKRIAKTFIAGRRDFGAMTGLYDATSVYRCYGNYDPEYRSFLKEMKSTDQTKPVTQYITVVRGIDETKKESEQGR